MYSVNKLPVSVVDVFSKYTVVALMSLVGKEFTTAIANFGIADITALRSASLLSIAAAV